MHLLGFREVVNTSLLILCFVAFTFLSILLILEGSESTNNWITMSGNTNLSSAKLNGFNIKYVHFSVNKKDGENVLTYDIKDSDKGAVDIDLSGMSSVSKVVYSSYCKEPKVFIKKEKAQIPYGLFTFAGGGTTEVYKVKKVILPISYKYDNDKSDLVKESQIIVN